MARKGQGALSIAGVCGVTLFLCSAAVGAFHVYMSRPVDVLPYALVIAVPFMTTISFLLVSALVPTMYGGGKLVFPVTVTLPIVYSVLVMVSATLWSTTGSSLVRPQPILDVIGVWFNPTVVMLTVVIEFVVLTLMGKMQG
jgi:hypothetical protein